MRASKWTVAHSSVTGSQHRATGQDCQDFSCFALMPRLSPDTLVAVVADGLGSARLGGPAAQLAAETAGAEAVQRLWESRVRITGPKQMESILNSAVLKARMSLEDQASRTQTDLDELGTTLLLLIHSGETIAAAQIGDGAAVISTGNGEYHTFAKPQRGEYANQTQALTSRRALQLCEITIGRTKEPVQEIALMTDGIMSLSIDMATMNPHPPFFANMAGWLKEHQGPEHPSQELERILSTGITAKKTGDDLSLLLAVRNGLK